MVSLLGSLLQVYVITDVVMGLAVYNAMLLCRSINFYFAPTCKCWGDRTLRAVEGAIGQQGLGFAYSSSKILPTKFRRFICIFRQNETFFVVVTAVASDQYAM